MAKYKDGHTSFRGYGVYYKIFGSPRSRKTPLLVVHGGPGSSHNYLLSLAELSRERQVIFYDQLGGGLSERPAGDIWSMKLFLDELQTMRDQLELNRIHLLGHSWGGMLAIEYLLDKPYGIESVILASAMVSIPLYQQEVDKLKKDLPPHTYKTLIEHEAAGTTDSKAYANAMKVYDKHYIYRDGSFPAKYKTPKNSFCKESYHKLWGASEAFANGSLKNWDRIPRLQEIQTPTLIAAGQYDELTPHQAVVTHDSMPNSKLRIFTAASHCAHIEQEKEYLKTMANFLRQADQPNKG